LTDAIAVFLVAQLWGSQFLGIRELDSRANRDPAEFWLSAASPVAGAIYSMVKQPDNFTDK
jgi:hypothetical protein